LQSTRASKLLGEFRNMPPVNLEALEDVLLHVSQMICELPWLQELDLNPLIVDENGAIAADARIVIDYAAPSGDRYAHMAIHPYPVHLIQDWELPGWPHGHDPPDPPGRRRARKAVRHRRCPRKASTTVSWTPSAN
jgi:hypothetical protein